MNLTQTKILVAILFAIIRFFFGIFPVKLYKLLLKWEEDDDSGHFINKKRHEQVTRALALCQSFGGGVLFATCFLHMMPEVNKSMEHLKKFDNFQTDFPLSQLTVSLGFFLVYFVEEFSHWFVTKVPESCDNDETPESSRPISNNKVSPSKVSPSKVSQKTVYIIEDEMYKEKEATNNEAENEVLKENERNIEIVEEIEETSPEEIAEKNAMNRQQFVRYCLIVLALSLHAIFEGLAIGLQQSVPNIWYLFVAVSIHSATILFYISLELLLAKTPTSKIMLNVTVLSVTSPIGVFLGLLITQNANMNTMAKSTAVVLLEGLSAGTILYITFFEVLNREKARRTYTFLRALFIVSGFVLMAFLQGVEMSINNY